MKKKIISAMTKKERIQAAIRGEEVDRVPYSLWTHLPVIDLDPVSNAEHTYDFYKKYDVDILKTMNNGMYSVEDFGAKTNFSDVPKGGVARITETPVKEPEDWLRLKPVSVNEGTLAREQKYLKLLLNQTKGEVPVVFTVFSPLTTANKLCPSMMDHIRQGHGDKVKEALKVITETTCALVQRVIELGADGIFLPPSFHPIISQKNPSIGNMACPTIWQCSLLLPAGATCFMLMAKISCSPSFANIRCRFQLACFRIAAGNCRSPAPDRKVHHGRSGADGYYRTP